MNCALKLNCLPSLGHEKWEVVVVYILFTLIKKLPFMELMT